MKELEPSTNEREFLVAALKDGARIDGRNFYDFRTLRLSFGDDYGAVEVQLGNTRSEPFTTPFLTSCSLDTSLPFHTCSAALNHACSARNTDMAINTDRS